MDLKDLKLKQVGYIMQSFMIDVKGETFKVPQSQFVQIDIFKEYETELYPMWYVCCNVPLWFYSKMVKNYDDIFVTMNLQMAKADTIDELLQMESGTTEISGKFKCVIPYKSPVADETIQNEVEKQAEAYNENYTFNEYAVVELALYNIAAYNASFNMINAVHTLTNMTDAITYCYNQCSISPVLMSKADNTKKYKEFKILPESGIKNMLRIVEDYTFHDDHSTFFFDLTQAYLVTNKIGCYAWRNNEHKQVQILTLSEYSEGLGGFTGLHVDDKEKVTVIVADRQTVLADELNGAPAFTDTEETSFLRLTVRNGSLEILSPNKEYLITIDAVNNASKINGKYRLQALECTLIPEGEVFTPTFTLNFRR